ncbi:M56 family metallopeptidase [Dyadobacter chenwenxiniae]|uniref:M56 family metallopeptidase n=1 Tax=Dyadobacter chenwenxiniae TaxID=2906456 RepID=A0A9X1PP14_9BACT|nr:M56 family metallopeptidase [Dyadobacter chenwenxiniae]MCF0064725.1 M56 family metallopeptidase [Dyadobacter chenwenxiniae]UON84221.1 M56 family metallopeptidase [Dyadobacter chenwenxiniae]
MIVYFISVHICLIAGFGFYNVFLEKQTYFMLNRISLLCLAVLSFCIPAIPVKPHLSASIPLDLVIHGETLSQVAPQMWNDHITDWLKWAYFTGVFFKLGWLIIRFLYIRNKIKNPGDNAAFSFFKYKVVDRNVSNFEMIDYHEDVHIRQWHSLDILFFEIVAIVAWFNPVVYFYQRSIKRTHEFLADRETARHFGNYYQYASLILNRSSQSSPEMTNAFTDKHLLKQRIAMLGRNNASKANLAKYVLLIPVLLCLTSFSALYKNPAATAEMGRKGSVAPAFPGGLDAFLGYLSKEVSQSDIFKAHHDQGKVLVSFVVDTDGNVVSPQVMDSPNAKLNSEAVRIIRNSPRWSPGLQDGRVVRVRHEIKLGYQLSSTN